MVFGKFSHRSYGPRLKLENLLGLLDQSGTGLLGRTILGRRLVTSL